MVLTPHTIVHVPHAGTTIPARERAQFVLSEEALRAEQLRLTDRYTDELFAPPARGTAQLVFPYSRLLVDVERFDDDDLEPMAGQGMGAIYTRASDGRKLRRSLTEGEQARLLRTYYFPHHGRFEHMVSEALHEHSRCLVVDAHSFPSEPLRCDLDQSVPRPDICVGTDPYHTPVALHVFARDWFRERGMKTDVDVPYVGAIVPSRYLGRDDRVQSIMVEVNRRLYMDEARGEKRPAFDELRSLLAAFLGELSEVSAGRRM